MAKIGLVPTFNSKAVGHAETRRASEAFFSFDLVIRKRENPFLLLLC